MPSTTGVVEAVSVKPLASQDQYGNTHRISIKIGNDWYSAGASKGGSYINKNATEVNKGDKIEFMYDQNGDFKNVKRPTLSILSKSSSSGSSQAAPLAQGSAPSYNGSPNPAEVGQCINLAVQLGLAKSYDELLSQDVMFKAIQLYKKAKLDYTNAWNIKEKKEEPKQEEEFVDSGIPF